jgi:hypothetical protein
MITNEHPVVTANEYRFFVGMEWSLLPEIAQQDFQISAYSAMLSFIVVFGTVKAISNYFAGSLANHLPKSPSHS